MPLLVLLFSLATHASPEVGDYVKFTKLFTGSEGETAIAKYSREILKFNSETGDFLIRSVESYPDETNMVTEYTWPKELLTSDAEIDNTLNNCKDLGGDIEYLQVGEESLKTCRLETREGSETTVDWHAHVPFGLAKFSSHIRYGRGITATVVEFNRGR